MGQPHEDFFQSGMTLAIGGGSNVNRPALLVRKLLQSKADNLKIVSFSVGMYIDILVSLGRVTQLIVPCVGHSFSGKGNPFIRVAVETGSLEVISLDEDLFYASLSASAMGLSFVPISGEPVGAMNEHPHLFKPIQCPFTEKKFWALSAMRIHGALIRSEEHTSELQSH